MSLAPTENSLTHNWMCMWNRNHLPLNTAYKSTHNSVFRDAAHGEVTTPTPTQTVNTPCNMSQRPVTYSFKHSLFGPAPGDARTSREGWVELQEKLWRSGKTAEMTVCCIRSSRLQTKQDQKSQSQFGENTKWQSDSLEKGVTPF